MPKRPAGEEKNKPGTSKSETNIDQKQPVVGKSEKSFTINEETSLDCLTESLKDGPRRFSTDLEEYLTSTDNRDYSRTSGLLTTTTTDDEYKILPNTKVDAIDGPTAGSSKKPSFNDSSSEDTIPQHHHHCQHHHHHHHCHHYNQQQQQQQRHLMGQNAAATHKSISDYVFDNEYSDSDSDLSDIEDDLINGRYIRLPRIEHNHFSKAEINTSKEIQKIDQNVEANTSLKKENDEKHGDFKEAPSETLVMVTDPES